MRKDLISHQIDLDLKDNLLELVCVAVKCNGTSVNFCCLYKPSVTSIELLRPIKDAIKCLVAKQQPLVLMGDFNLPGISWDPVLASSTYKQNEFLNIFLSNGLKQIVTEPTRKTAILDLVFVNEPNLVHYVTVGPPLKNCDHSTVCFDVNISPFTPNTYSARDNWNRADVLGMENELNGVNWETFFLSCKTSNEMWILFRDYWCIIHNATNEKDSYSDFHP